MAKQTTTPDPAHTPPRRGQGIPPQFDATVIKPMTSEAQEAADPGSAKAATSPGAPGTGLQGLPPGVRETLVVPDTFHVP